MSWNDKDFECDCGRCTWCLGRERQKAIYRAPKSVMFAWLEKESAKEEREMAAGWMRVQCPKCRQYRKVLGSTLHRGFSCDRCGYRTP